MIETGLVYIHAATPKRQFVGCGALVEGGYITTCRHVWRDATNAASRDPDAPPGVVILFPRMLQDGTPATCGAGLADPCAPGAGEPEPDLVLLLPEHLPPGVMSLQLAAHERFEIGAGYAIAGLAGRDPRQPRQVRDVRVNGAIAEYRDSSGRRQFTGDVDKGYWPARGSSGSPVFRDGGQQLAGILSLSELGAEPGDAPLHETFIVPATTIRRYVGALVAAPMAEQQGIKLADLRPILEQIGAADVAVAEIPERLRQFVEAARARGAEPVAASKDSADIDAVIGAARDKLGALDAAGARGLLQAKIAEEEAARRARLLPLLKERAAIERLSFDHAAAQATLGEVTRLDPDDVWAWIDLGNEWRITGPLESALRCFRSALTAAERTGDQRDQGVSHDRLGEVLVAQGDLPGALEAYRHALAIRETLTARDPSNAQWQRDLSVSHNRFGDVLLTQGNLLGALGAYRRALAIREVLAARDPGNTQWQIDLSASQNRLGDVLEAQGDLPGALEAYRQALAIRERLATRDPSNTQWQRDLPFSHNRLGDIGIAQGNLPVALAAFRQSLAIREGLVARDPGNAQWQRELSVSHNRLGDVLVAQGALSSALGAYRQALAIRQILAARDPGNTQWQRDLSVCHNRLGDVLEAQGNLSGALDAHRQARAISETLAARDPENAELQRDLSVSHEKTGDVLRAQGDLPGALAAYRRSLAIAETLAERDPDHAEWQRDVCISLGRVADALLRQDKAVEARKLAERALRLVREAITRMPGDPRLSRDLPHYEALLRRADGTP